MAVAITPSTPRAWRPGAPLVLVAVLVAALVLALAGQRLVAQIEGDRGIAPVASTSDIMVGGIVVNTTGKNADEARAEGWKLAQKLGWEKLKGPAMSPDQIDSMVSAIVVEREQIGPRRYIATLGVIFDRARAGQFLGGSPGGGDVRARSAPLLVIPVLRSAGVSQVFEIKGQWQRAWAEFRTNASPVDYVRPSGAGGDSLLLTAGQPGRRSRTWWRNVLDQFGAADVIMPMARLERQWPGGPVRGTFVARYGPDNTYLDSFVLTAHDEAGVPAMLDKALVQLDAIYAAALAQGVLRPDPGLAAEQGAIDSAMAALQAALHPVAEPTAAAQSVDEPTAAASSGPATISSVTVQFASPDASAIDAALSAVRGAPGVQGASTSSIAIGGTSVMRVTLAGDISALAAALRARGWQVSVGGGTLSIRR